MKEPAEFSEDFHFKGSECPLQTLVCKAKVGEEVNKN